MPGPPLGKTGWPWVAERTTLPPTAPGGRPWPRISLVTPNYNHAEYLEAAIRSVLLQGYPNLEYMVIDGGSSDASVEIIKRYEPWLTYWESQPDRGQTHAINKGFARSTGEVVNWLCSDDRLMPRSLEAIGSAFAESPDDHVVWGRTDHRFLNAPHRDYVDRPALWKVTLIPAADRIWQPSCFYRRALLTREPALDESLHFAMDLELWAYFASRGARWRVIDSVISRILWTDNNKTLTGGDRIRDEMAQVYCRYVSERIPLTWWHRRFRTPIEKLWMWSKGRRFGSLRYLLLMPELLYVLLLGPFYGFRRTAFMERRGLYEMLMAMPVHGTGARKGGNR